MFCRTNHIVNNIASRLVNKKSNALFLTELFIKLLFRLTKSIQNQMYFV